MFAHSFPLLSFLLLFSFLKNYFWGAVPIHTPQRVTGKGGKHVFLASFQLDWLHIIVIWIPVLVFLHFHLSFYFRRNKYPLHIWLRGKSGGDTFFCLDKWLDSVLPWAIRVWQGFMVAHMFYMEYTLWNDSWIAQGTEAQQLNRADRQLFTSNLHMQTLHIGQRYGITTLSLTERCVHICLECFPSVTFKLSRCKNLPVPLQ